MWVLLETISQSAALILSIRISLNPEILKTLRRSPAVILSIRIALSPGNPEALNILSPRPALILSTRAHIALNPPKNTQLTGHLIGLGFEVLTISNSRNFAGRLFLNSR